MPELPEVETIKNCLIPEVVGHRFTGATLLWARMIRFPSPDEFGQRIAGQTVKSIDRRGKYLLFRLSGRDTLVLHLKMTGSLLLLPSSSAIDVHTRAVLHLDGGFDIHFRDQRKFGVMWLVEDEATVVGKLGREPLDNDFTADLLGELLQRHSVPIKALLVDQGVIAGIGNMYADEALFAAGIHPLRMARNLSNEEVGRLHHSVRQVLTAAIGYGGASVSTYQQPSGETGNAQFYFKVAHRRGQKCYRCGGSIERIVVRQRGTYFCPRCQPAGKRTSPPVRR